MTIGDCHLPPFHPGGCRHFIPLEGALGHDWGICANPASPRCALLTFEHQGCSACKPKN